MFSKCVGTSFREVPWEKLRADHPLVLLFDDDNPYDPMNAIAVWWPPEHWEDDRDWKEKGKTYEQHIKDTCTHIGFIPATTAAVLRATGAEFFQCSITEITGGTKGKRNFGINIRIEYTDTGRGELVEGAAAPVEPKPSEEDLYA